MSGGRDRTEFKTKKIEPQEKKKMIYAEETASKRIKVDLIPIINWKIIFFFDNVNSVEEVCRKFFEFLVRKGIICREQFNQGAAIR